MASLDSTDKVRVRYHLGYPASDRTGVSYAGMIWSSENLNQLEYAMDQVDGEAIWLIQRCLAHLETIEDQQISALERLQAHKADVVTLNPLEHSKLLEQYRYWQGRLATNVGGAINPYQENSGVSLNVAHRRPK